MPTLKSRLALASVAVVLLLGSGLYAFKRVVQLKPTVFLTTKVTRSTIEISVSAIGILHAIKQVDVGAQVSGQLKELKVQLGEHVAKGQWLAEIDPVLSENSLRSVQANWDSLQAQKQAAEANLWQVEIALKRQKEMIAAEATSRQELEAAKAGVLVNKANIASLDAQMRQAKTQVDSAKASLAYTRIMAPIEGEVAAILTQEGQTIVAAQQAPVILKIANLDQMTVHAQISEADVTKIHIGDEATFTILGNPQDQYSGKLRAIEPAPQAFLNDVPKVPGPVFYNALFDVPNSARKLRIGMTAKVLIVLKRVPNAMLVPISALGAREASGKYAIRIVRANQPPHTVWVPVGISNNIRTEILDGLKEGDEVVIGESVETH
jgi:macrolide-specific efflux system membrane fusion protein